MLNNISHHIIAVVMSLVVFVTGLLFGIKLSSATEGTQGMTILIFALGFLTIAVLFMLFTQLVHIRESLAKLPTEKKRKGGS